MYILFIFILQIYLSKPTNLPGNRLFAGKFIAALGYTDPKKIIEDEPPPKKQGIYHDLQSLDETWPFCHSKGWFGGTGFSKVRFRITPPGKLPLQAGHDFTDSMDTWRFR